MGKILKVQMIIPEKGRKATVSFRCPKCNKFINKKEEDLNIACPNCGINLNVRNIDNE